MVKYNPLRIDMTSHFNETEKRTVYSEKIKGLPYIYEKKSNVYNFSATVNRHCDHHVIYLGNGVMTCHHFFQETKHASVMIYSTLTTLINVAKQIYKITVQNFRHCFGDEIFVRFRLSIQIFIAVHCDLI